MALEQRRNLVEIMSLRCFKQNFDVVPTYSARWDDDHLRSIHSFPVTKIARCATDSLRSIS